ncbi:MAG: glycosyltransferase family 4 protein [Parcubacteria group bacterium]
MTTEKINILFIHPYRQSVGPNFVLLHLLRYLSCVKYNFFVAMPATLLDNEISAAGASIFHIPAMNMLPRSSSPIKIVRYLLLQMSTLVEIKKIVNQNDIDIVHVSTTAYWPIGIISRFCRVKCVFHGQDLTSMTPKWAGRIGAFFLNLFADKVVCVSQAVQSAWSAVGVRKNKLAVVLNGVNLDRFKPISRDSLIKITDELKLKGRWPILGMIASFDPRKGHEYLVRASIVLKQKFPNILFLLIGSSTTREYVAHLEHLKTIIDDNALVDNFRFLGERTDIPQLINLCDLLIMPSETEAGPFVALEIQACGKYLIASAVGGLPEYLDDGKTGFLVPAKSPQAIAEAVSRFFDANGMVPSINTTGMEFVRRFQLHEQINKVENIYRAIL